MYGHAAHITSLAGVLPKTHTVSNVKALLSIVYLESLLKTFDWAYCIGER